VKYLVFRKGDLKSLRRKRCHFQADYDLHFCKWEYR